MKTIKKILAVIIVASLFIMAGCQKSLEKTKEEVKKVISMGQMEGNTYSNEYFGMKITVPEEWTIATEEEKEMIMNAGSQAVSEGNEKLEKQLDLAKVKTLNLLFAFKHPLTYTDGTNANILCVGENLGLAGITIKTGEDYLKESKKLLEEAQLPYTFGEFVSETVGGKEFNTMEASLEMNGMSVTQKYYATIIEGYALVFTITYFNDEELQELNSIMATIEFAE